MKTRNLSKFLSLTLRHEPELIGLTLDSGGWTSVEELVRKANAAGRQFTTAELFEVVATNDKKRFTLSPDQTRIRAAQGHSIDVQLELTPVEPPTVLYHGTARRFVQSILQDGLKPQSRQQVHLAADKATAQAVGRRHGKPVVFVVQALRMHNEGSQFFMADNGVWLTDYVAPEFLTTPTSP